MSKAWVLGVTDVKCRRVSRWHASLIGPIAVPAWTGVRRPNSGRSSLQLDVGPTAMLHSL